MDEIMKMDVNDTGEGVQLLANMLAKCALELYELTESDFSLCIETNDGRNIEIAIREIGEEHSNEQDD